MNKFTVISANNTKMLFQEMIKQLKGHINNTEINNVIIVPDRLSLLTEQQIFDLLDIEVYFNIEVMGISKFANKIIKENCLDLVECSSFEAKLLTLKAIQNVCKNFKCFSTKYTLGFVDEIYAKIEQIKSSGADIKDLIDEGADEGTKLKFEDLRLIYNEYEKLRGNKLDSGAVLSLFANVCGQSEYLKKCNVLFVGFDSMTRQGIEVVRNVAHNAINTYVGVVAPRNQNNFKIYDSTFLNGIIEMCKNDLIEADFKWLDLPLENRDANIIINNIFSRKNTFDGSGYINIYRALSVADEIDSVIKSVNFLLKTEDVNFNDIAICAPADYHDLISSKLNNIGIDTFADEKKTLSFFEPVKLIMALAKYANDGANDNLIQILSNDFFDIDDDTKEDIINLIAQFSSVETILKYGENINDKTKETLNKLLNCNIKNGCDTIKNYINIIKKMIENVNLYAKIADFCDNMRANGEIELEKTYKQLEQKIESIFDECESVLAGQSLKFAELLELIESAFDNMTISGVPCGVNEIFIGDYKSFYGNVKYLYTMGLNEGVMPEVLNDSGLITDKEITSETIKALIEPTTKIINKRNKFKLLEVILSPAYKSYLFYHTAESDGKNAQPSEIITELKFLFKLKDVNVGDLKFYDSSSIGINKVCYNCVDTYNANLNLKNTESNIVQALVRGALIENGDLFLLQKQIDEFSDYNKLFFKNGKASVSLVEKYNMCPRSAFWANGLKLRKSKKRKIEASTIGTFIHKIGEMFVRKNKNKLGGLGETEICAVVDELCGICVLDDDFYALRLEENKFLFKMICEECKRFCLFINYEQSVSNFKPRYTEKYFGENSEFNPIVVDVDGEKYRISGIVDRVDYMGDYFRIIDYKTGNTTNSKGKENLFYGQKVQLFVYAEAIQNNSDKKLFGAFYLPIKNAFTSDNKSPYSLSGFFVNSVFLVRECDKNFGIDNPKCELLGASLNKPKNNGELALKKKANQLSAEELYAYCKYAIQIVKTSIKNMKDGYIEYSPFKEKCGNCEFNKICKYAKNEDVQRADIYKVANEDFLEIINGKE